MYRERERENMLKIVEEFDGRIKKNQKEKYLNMELLI